MRTTALTAEQRWKGAKAMNRIDATLIKDGTIGDWVVVKDHDDHETYSGDLEAFAEWVARQVCREDFDEDGTFAEMACRRLWRLGFVRMNGENWEYGEVEE